MYQKRLFYPVFKLHDDIRLLWLENVLWTRFFIISAIFSLPDIQSVIQRLLRNPEDFAKIFRCFYNDKIAKRFEELFSNFLFNVTNMANVVKEENQQNFENLRGNCQDSARELARFLAHINPYWNERQLFNLFNEYLGLRADEVLLIFNGRYRESIRLFEKIQDQALKTAQIMISGLIWQFRLI